GLKFPDGPAQLPRPRGALAENLLTSEIGLVRLRPALLQAGGLFLALAVQTEDLGDFPGNGALQPGERGGHRVVHPLPAGDWGRHLTDLNQLAAEPHPARGALRCLSPKLAGQEVRRPQLPGDGLQTGAVAEPLRTRTGDDL